ncbi:serine hydrolase domain-containing protein [Candidatus Eisenbacteria bacterium]|uniref:Serine hydrolase domain-containing protein n=1 Tax=Eiseniibacteriota bacterium TaxID=2212470 RepID=A0ABV6YM46_UNCEI
MAGKALMVSVVYVLALVAGSAAAQAPGGLGYTDVPDLPGGIEGERVQMLFDAVNNNDADLLTRFYNDHLSDEFKAKVPLEKVLESIARFAHESGGIDFHSVRHYDPPRENQTTLIFSNRNFDRWQACVFSYEEGEKPDGILNNLLFDLERPPSDVEPPRPLSEAESIDEVHAFVERLCEEDVFSGVVLLANAYEVLFERACGEASKRFHVPVNKDTKFNMASAGKMFTAIAIAQLVEKGVLSFDDHIGKYVDETWYPKNVTDAVTVHHLLTHTSGLGDFFNETFHAGSRGRWRELDDYRELITGDTLTFEPGTDWQYSNIGAFMLGVVIESATREDYFDYIRENVFEPTGMDDTDFYDMDCPVENLAIGYRPSSDCSSGWKNNYYELVMRGSPAGGAYSTAPDLLKFARALETGTLVSQELLDLMWIDHFNPERSYGYGYGFTLRQGPAGRVVGHNGKFSGINADFNIFLDKGYVLVVMSNYHGVGSQVDERIRKLIARVE